MAQNLLLLLKIDFGGSEGRRRGSRGRGCGAGGGVGRLAKRRVEFRSFDKDTQSKHSGSRDKALSRKGEGISLYSRSVSPCYFFSILSPSPLQVSEDTPVTLPLCCGMQQAGGGGRLWKGPPIPPPATPSPPPSLQRVSDPELRKEANPSVGFIWASPSCALHLILYP